MNRDDYYPELEDLLADLGVLTKFEHRIGNHPDLRAKIESIIPFDQFEAMIKALAAVIHEFLRGNKKE